MTVRVVLDTKVVVSALLFDHGHLAWLRDGWVTSRFLPLSATATAQEIVRVLAYPKFQLGTADIEVLLADYLPFVETVDIPARVAVPEPPDADDRMFLELAKAARAEFLVTGDRGLLGISSVGRCRILRPAEFRAIFSR